MKFKILSLLCLFMLDSFGEAAAPLSKLAVAVSIDRKFAGDGVYRFKISERGIGPNGKYTREYAFRAPVKQGFCLPSTFEEYKSTLVTAKAGSWETQREPIAGYCLIVFRDDRVYVDIELIELLDQHPVALGANGIHLLREKSQR